MLRISKTLLGLMLSGEVFARERRKGSLPSLAQIFDRTIEVAAHDLFTPSNDAK